MICDFSAVAFSVFGFPIHWYSLAYIFGIIIALKLTEKFFAKSHYEEGLRYTDEFISYIVFGIIIGGRLGHVLFYDFDFYFHNPIEIVKVWHGGMSFFGGFLGIAMSTFLFCKKNQIDFWRFIDIWAVSVPIGLFFGRIANFINGELLGKATDSISWFVVFNDGIPRHPSQIYEAILEGIVLFAIMLFAFYKKQYNFRGKLSGIFCSGYGFFRFIGELFREPDSLFSHRLYFQTGINLNQYMCFALIALGIFLIYRSDINDSSEAN